jgi:acetaldehyde dehydrogenase (acetylating)
VLNDSDLVSIQEVRAKVERAYTAFQHTRRLSQDRIDAIVEAMGEAARANARRLAEMAVEETGYGNAKDKLAKNLLCADLLPRTIRGMKTVGVLREDPEKKVLEIGTPVGVVAAILPTTNPTSTAIYKSIISLKAGNTVVVSPHPRAKACTCETVRVMAEAALAAGAPEGAIQCIANATMEGTDALMRHRRTGVILATGGSGIVKAAYSSGKPAFGVGPGNVPVCLDESADTSAAIAKVVAGKSFDYGTVCSSEQTVVALTRARESVLSELRRNDAYLCNAEQTKALAKLLIAPNWRINADCVGQAPTKVARMAGFEVPESTSILVVEIGGVGKEHPLSMEKLSPVLSVIFVNDWMDQIRTCQAILAFGGLGHTCVIHANDDDRIREYGARMPAFRVLVNTPAPQGSTGITTSVFPAMTLGCGAMAGNATSDNIGPLHLVNVKRVAYVVRTVEEAFPDGKGSRPAPIASAVERFLSQRGLGGTAGAAAAPRPVAAVVDRFLAARRPPQPSCCTTTTDKKPGPEPDPAPPAPQITISDFVCEADVRTALHKGEKIYVGSKSIVTPAARELANQHGLIIMAQR